ncbi:winged helix-turn-helix domain-containing protein [Nonomuraea purpurea]|uniref:Winged helix-turn-helix domain-containing protein n=1 Tax=Nonomuraea purpurea TaxID=1849276 RepID=A0ABV8GLJ6_9ACTN
MRDRLPAAPRAPTAGAPDARLLGPTRAAILRATVNGATTGELARRHGISSSGVSRHTQILREAGLIVIHTVTPLGTALPAGGR